MQIPPEAIKVVMYGPAWTFDDETADLALAAAGPCSPARAREIYELWPGELPQVAGRVEVPVQYHLAEFDSLWSVSDENAVEFASFFKAAPFIDARVAHAIGHNIDHHRLGWTWRQRELARAPGSASWT